MQTIESRVIMQDDKVTIPAAVRARLHLANGREVGFIMNGEDVRIVNPALLALRQLQEAMKGEAERAGLYTEDDVVALVKEVRAELAEERASKDESVYRHEYSDLVHNMA